MALVNRKGWKFQTGTTAEHDKALPDGELSIDTDKKVVVTHDGVTVGGTPMAKESDLTDHEADTTNPHSVTKAQVGLTNVTDDAQLKRAAGDINSFTLKAIPVSADVVLIEDSADGYAKKKATVGTVGTTTFTGLTDTPANFTGAAGQVAKVNSGETALEFGAFVANPVTADVDFATYKAVAMACDNGTSFPATPATAQWFYRTDIDTLFMYEGAWKPMVSFSALTLYVDDVNGTDAAGKGYATGADAVKTINYAIGLLPLTSAVRPTIKVAAGTYREQVEFAGQKATLSGEDAMVTLTSGTATSATSTTLTVTGAGWTVNAYEKKFLWITGGTGSGQKVFIISNTADTLTVQIFATTPNSTSTFAIKEPGARITGSNAGSDTTSTRAYGVRLQERADVDICCFLINYCTVAGVRIDLSSSGVTDNIIHNCANYGGILYIYTSAVKLLTPVARNIIYTCNYGMAIYSNSIPNIQGNHVKGSTLKGLWIRTGSFCSFMDSNLVEDSGSHGVWVEILGGVAFSTAATRTMTIKNNGGWGLLVETGGQVTGHDAASVIYSGNALGSYSV